MTPDDLKKFYGNSYQFRKRTGMSDASFRNWIKWGYVPEASQYKLERLTGGKLKTQWSE
jgi:ABC-type long-subunit fatty acid transport system fused permease/ATPase subunit